jgi:hypothetical protein
MLKIWEADNFRRTVVGLCLIMAPLVLLLGNIFHPGEGEAGLVNTIAEHPGRVQAASLLIIFASVLLVPALVGLLYLLRDRGVVLGHIGVGLALIGAVVGHAVWAGFQIVLLGFIQNGIDREQLSMLLANSDGASEWHLRAIFEAGLMRFGTRSGAPYEFANSISYPR